MDCLAPGLQLSQIIVLQIVSTLVIQSIVYSRLGVRGREAAFIHDPLVREMKFKLSAISPVFK